MCSRYVTELHVTMRTALHVVEQSPGVFIVFKDNPGDLRVHASRRDKSIRWIDCDECRDSHGFFWEDVCYDELEDHFKAPSYERLLKALERLDLRVYVD